MSSMPPRSLFYLLCRLCNIWPRHAVKTSSSHTTNHWKSGLHKAQQPYLEISPPPWCSWDSNHELMTRAIFLGSMTGTVMMNTAIKITLYDRHFGAASDVPSFAALGDFRQSRSCPVAMVIAPKWLKTPARACSSVCARHRRVIYGQTVQPISK